jgi:hypothetical protein
MTTHSRTHEERMEDATTYLQRWAPSMAPQVRSTLADSLATSVEAQVLAAEDSVEATSEEDRAGPS